MTRSAKFAQPNGGAQPVGAIHESPEQVKNQNNQTSKHNPVGADFHVRPNTVGFCTNQW